MNISMFLQMAAEACPDRIALTFANERYSYGALYDAAQVAAARIRESGAAYASVIDVSNPSVPIMLMGAALAGVPYVPLNFRLTEEEIRALMSRISPVYLCADETNLKRFADDNAVTLVSRSDFLSECTGTTVEASESPMDP